MPWRCETCGAEALDDRAACAACGGAKRSWTLHAERTRTLVIPTPQLVVKRGERPEPLLASEAHLEDVALHDTDEARALRKRDVLALHRAGKRPAPLDVLFLVYGQGNEPGKKVGITVEYANAAADPRTYDFQRGGWWESRFVFVRGAAPDGWDAVAFPGLDLVDVHEEGEPGHAPTVEVGVQRKRKELRVVPVGVDPTPAAWVMGGGLFAFDSAFPTPAVSSLCTAVSEAAGRHAELRFAVFGHADKQGSQAYNKKLSDRRARAVLAMLTGDLEALARVATDDGWGELEHKAMLRAIGCDPGPIAEGGDGATARAVRVLQRAWNEGRFHRSSHVPPRTGGDLAVDGDLGPLSRAALLEAYRNELSPFVDAARFVGPAGAGFSGCGEFNPIGDPAANRRVTVAAFTGEVPPAAEFPCKAGSASACPVDGQPQRCPFYRRWVPEAEAAAPASFPFWDPVWLRDPDAPGRVCLSAVSTAPDGAAATFEVFFADKAPASPGADSSDGAPPPDHGAPVATVQGTVRRGIAFAEWTHGPEHDPFDPSGPGPAALDEGALDALARLKDGSLLPADHPWLTGAPARVPVFRVRVGDTWSDSEPPGYRLDRVRVDEAAEGEGGTARLVDGRFVRVVVQDGWLRPELVGEVEVEEAWVVALLLDDGAARGWESYV